MGRSRESNDWGHSREPNDWGHSRRPNDWGPSRGPNDWGPSRGPNDWGPSRGSNDWGPSRGARPSWGKYGSGPEKGSEKISDNIKNKTLKRSKPSLKDGKLQNPQKRATLTQERASTSTSTSTSTSKTTKQVRPTSFKTAEMKDERNKNLDKKMALKDVFKKSTAVKQQTTSKARSSASAYALELARENKQKKNKLPHNQPPKSGMAYALERARR